MLIFATKSDRTSLSNSRPKSQLHDRHTLEKQKERSTKRIDFVGLERLVADVTHLFTAVHIGRDPQMTEMYAE
jgi:hypothetical protein